MVADQLEPCLRGRLTTGRCDATLLNHLHIHTWYMVYAGAWIEAAQLELSSDLAIDMSVARS
jgi:hypothetical protein